jgi:hypothetical protein
MSRLHIEAPEVEASEALASDQMGIRSQDMHILLDILRNKLYKEPLKAAVREYVCNARDAHREVGTPDLPIRIVLPTELSKQIEIQDFGPGISPRRMADIFLNYGASTKRRDNKQTGCMGLGSKSALALGPSFNIVTVYGGVKRHYREYIDETKIGCIDLLSEEPTDEPTGTTIIIPTRAGEEVKYARAVVTATRFWDVLPEVVNMPAGVEFPVRPEPVVEGEDWALLGFKSLDWNAQEKVLALLDGIAYPVTTNDLGIESRDWRANLFSKALHLKFKTGQLSIVPSRDSLQFDERTVNAISRRLDQVRKVVFENALAKLAEQKTLLEAEWYWHDFMAAMPGVVKNNFKPEWNGIPLRGVTIVRADNEPVMETRVYYTRKSRKTDELKLKWEAGERIGLGESVRVFWNDAENLRGYARRIMAYIRAEQEATGKEISLVLVSFPTDHARDYWLRERHLFDLGAKPITSLPEVARAPRGTRPTVKRTDIDCWRFERNYRGDKDTDRCWEPTVEPKADTDENDEHHYYILSVNKNAGEFDLGTLPAGLISSGYSINDDVEKILSLCGIETIYLVSRRLRGQLDKDYWSPLEDVLRPKVEELFGHASTAEIERAAESGKHLVEETLSRSVLRILRTAIAGGRITVPSVIDYVNASDAASKEFDQLQKMGSLCDAFFSMRPRDGAAVAIAQQKLPQHPIVLKHQTVRERFPLLFKCSDYVKDDELVDYIEAMEKFHNAKNIVAVPTPTATTTIDDDPMNYCVAV